MPTYIVRPTSVLANGGGTTPSAQATVLTNIGDNSDVTTVVKSGNSAVQWRFGLGTTSIPTDEFVCRVGHAIRWSGGGVTGIPAPTVGVIAYRSIDPVPATIPTLTTTGSFTAVTTEVSYTTVSWTTAQVNSMHMVWRDNKVSPQPNVTTYDIWANIYTLKNATATPTATTMTASVYPVIPVSVTATIDWESSTYDWQNLRKITTEVRIESGGTGAGTGTLIATQTQDNYFTATGTQAQTITFTTGVANGTYNIYARAIRYREGQTAFSADQYGAWSSAATLTMNVAAPATPTVTPFGDNNFSRIGIGVTLNASANYGTPASIEIQRSDNGGTTWAAIRGGTVTIPRMNMISNPSFETNTTGWTGTNASLSRQTAPTPQSGSGLLQVQANVPSSTAAAGTATGTSGIPVAPSTAYILSAYARSQSNSRTVTVQIDWYNAAGTFLSSTSTTGVATSTTAWTRYSTTGTSPATAAFARAFIQFNSILNAGENHYVDAVLLERGSTLNTYLDFASSITVYDYEMPRGISVSYRARMIATAGTISNVGAYSAGNSGSVTATNWNLKCPENSAINDLDINVVGQPTEDMSESVGVFRPLDRRYPIVVSGSLGSWDGSLEIITLTAAEWTSLITLLEVQKVLLLESPFGWSKYIRIVGGVRTKISGTPTAPRRHIVFDYVQTIAP